MKKIGEGVTAEIFEIDSDTIMKLYKPIFTFIADKEKFVETEYEIMNTLLNYPVRIPRPIEAKIQGTRNGYTMERVKGFSLMYLIEENFFAYELYAIFFGKLHSSVNKIDLENNNDFSDTQERIYQVISKNSYILGGYYKSIISLFNDLPTSQNLCHNDFHLGNVIVGNNKSWVIDWDGAGRGDYHGDIARTIMLIRYCSPNIIHGPKTWSVREKFIKKYLNAYNENIKINYELLLKWEIIRAAELIILGAPFKEELWKFIENNIS
ncbi:phosphotransferase [Clostridiaceae bacterium UIB06]|uniref:Phosphotransferase n=1 Tax=Clostridium thailandense TaxID=2794346 RepID=A0A949TYJ7_9CLOT|nr:aminoglycoside phosphotransferase family protein [Clostridium thailandense]MBV7273238.1 phosphotransferase [Clostridium thailandense]MCH5137965.1 phosphotransferase [Clostridiaceae bacterium UIB06]